MPRLISVNVSPLKEVQHGAKTVATGIFKEPVGGPVHVGRLNIDGDRQADLSVHGGPDRPVYAYPHEHYDYWAHELGRDAFAFGQFGENLTVEGFSEAEVCIGDRLRIGDVLLEVSQPRLPCFKMAIAISDSRFPKMMLESGRLGFYLRVIEEGSIKAGQEIEIVGEGAERLTIPEAIRLMVFDRNNLEGLKRAASVEALSDDWRVQFRERIEALRESAGHH